jgi:putative endonuclease
MPCFVYILQSESTAQYYIGHTDNLDRRLSQHNNVDYHGSKHTKRSKGPWISVYTESFGKRYEAMQRDKEIKAKKSKVYIEYLLSRQSPEGVRD